MLQQGLSSRNPAFYITDACYADDIAALDENEAGLQETTSLFAEHALVAGLEINTKKSQVMFVNKPHVQQPYPKDCTLNIVTNNTQLEQVSHFCYLG